MSFTFSDCFSLLLRQPYLFWYFFSTIQSMAQFSLQKVNWFKPSLRAFSLVIAKRVLFSTRPRLDQDGSFLPSSIQLSFILIMKLPMDFSKVVYKTSGLKLLLESDDIAINSKISSYLIGCLINFPLLFRHEGGSI